MKNILIGGAWPYANNDMHLGHIAALLPGDIIARYHRQKGDNVVYVSGSDAHGTPITERAKNEGVNPAEIANHYHDEFVHMFELLDFSYDCYGITSSDFHKEKVKELLESINNNGYFYEKDEKADFCNTCDEYLSDREIIGICPYCKGEAKGDQCEVCLRTLESNEVLDKKCKTCGNSPTLKDNRHMYFKLSAFQNYIQKLLDENKDKWRKNAINETSKYLENGLIDRAITRQLTWGIDVPFPGYEDKKIYVWIEAVMGYLTMLQKVCLDKKMNYEDFISGSKVINYYVHGKDNIPFHTIIWPALLKAINSNYIISPRIISSEYMNVNDTKMSKSTGNSITAKELVEKFHKDTIRYYFISNNPENRDANFSLDDMLHSHNKFLVGVLGNFINRNFSYINKKFDGIIAEGIIDSKIKKYTKELYNKVFESIEKGQLKSAINAIMDYCVMGNKYYDEGEPWLKVKEDINEFNNISYTCTYMIANIANLLNPFIPDSSKKILNMINIFEFTSQEIKLKGEIKLNNVELLFERMEENV